MWVKVDDALPNHPKILDAGMQLGPTGVGRVLAIWLRGMCYCNHYLTDGFLPEEVIKTWKLYDKKPLDVVFVMVQAGILRQSDRRGMPGYQFHDYEMYQPLAADIKEKRDWDARRKQLYSIPGLIDAIRARDGDRCRYCAVTVNWHDRRGPKGGTYDHVIPRGPNSLENVVVACSRCNTRKGGWTPEQAGMPLLPPQHQPDPNEPSRNQIRPSSDQIPDSRSPIRSDPSLSTGTHQEKEHRASRGMLSAHVENLPVLKALIWREVTAALADPDESFDLPSVTERCKVAAARAGLVYDLDFFGQHIETAIKRVAQQAATRRPA